MARTNPTLPLGQPGYALRPADGLTEMAIALAAESRLSRPERVTRLLVAALESVDGVAATPARLRQLSSGTREWLLQRLAALFRPRDDWFEAQCPACGAAYDLELDLAALPVKPEGADFPTVTVTTSLGARQFDIPNGADEEAMPALARSGDPRRLLLALCGHAERAESEAADFTEADLEAIDEALDAAAFQPSDQSLVECPDCGHQSAARIDPVSFAFPREITLLTELHQIAASYHWTEDQILALPTRRRRHYLGLIHADQARRRARR